MPLKGEAKRKYNKKYRQEIKKDPEKYKQYKARKRANNHKRRKKGPIIIVEGRTILIRY